MTLEESLFAILKANNLANIRLDVTEWNDKPKVEVLWRDPSAAHGFGFAEACAETFSAALSDAITKANGIRFPAAVDVELPGDAIVLEGGEA